MTEKVIEIQEATIKDVQKKLRKHKKCLLVRPTGFGKTKMAIDIISSYKHAVFIYPSNSILEELKQYDTSEIDLHLFSMAKIRNLYKSNNLMDVFSRLNLKNTIFVIDEAHFMGATITCKALEKLLNEVCPNANYLGITATPNRTDKLEIKWHFFNGITAYEYTLEDAINDDIFVKPYYVYTPLNKKDLQRIFVHRIDSLSISKAKKLQLKDRVIKTLTPEKISITNIDDIIRNNLSKFKNDMNYYKFILYFTTFETIHSKKKEIIDSFQRVFPNCKINTIIVTSETHNTRKNINIVKNLKRKENTIDLIFNINMLTHGYHDGITGIMMFRRTISDIIYSQQTGRCLSVAHRNTTIIFDFVENLSIIKPDSVLPINRSNVNKLNRLGIWMSDDEILLDEETQELLDIDRLINNAIKEEFEFEVVYAYYSGLVDKVYCINKLHLHDVDDFYKVLERYGIKDENKM